jgi:hypothetical protein
LVVDRHGTPLDLRLTGANRHDSLILAEVLDAIGPILQPNGHRRKRSAKVHADKRYDYRRCGAVLRQRHIRRRIAHKGFESSTQMEKHR